MLGLDSKVMVTLSKAFSYRRRPIVCQVYVGELDFEKGVEGLLPSGVGLRDAWHPPDSAIRRLTDRPG